MIPFEDFEKLDIRCGKILDVADFPKAKKPAYRLLIDFGHLGKRRSSAQITALYKKEELIGRTVVAVVNFPAKNIGGFLSECLVLGVYIAEGKVELLSVCNNINAGASVR